MTPGRPGHKRSHSSARETSRATGITKGRCNDVLLPCLLIISPIDYRIFVCLLEIMLQNREGVTYPTLLFFTFMYVLFDGDSMPICCRSKAYTKSGIIGHYVCKRT